ncbi:HsdR family type I site-specific deoxyribonuclease [Deinococcus grandis]|uniref:HsdR family type I site-specific deoxyribonuclease n=1 Tax=Deinococcus grandis TaxID=57498 RepID=A0A117DPN7_9DEIO|nr:hypothetical protein [Deinococcus grandis]BBN96995.1 hypothetical protein DEGR_37280 [Deinococcus grandis]GAQ23729.1 HsdR family type I site-specific deoxyribonuclease [Deinococcus grandis]
MGSSYNEETVELAALEWLRGQGFETTFGPDIAPETPGVQRVSYQDVVLDGPLRAALVRLNPGASPEAVVEAVRQLSNPAPGEPGDALQRQGTQFMLGRSRRVPVACPASWPSAPELHH